MSTVMPTKGYRMWHQRLVDAHTGRTPLTNGQVIQFYNMVSGHGKESSCTQAERAALMNLLESWPEGVAISDEQTIKGLHWLRQQVRIKPDGRPANEAFIYEALRTTVERFSHFRFVGLAELWRTAYRVQYTPIYRVVDVDGSWFEYSHGAWQSEAYDQKVKVRTHIIANELVMAPRWRRIEPGYYELVGTRWSVVNMRGQSVLWSGSVRNPWRVRIGYEDITGFETMVEAKAFVIACIKAAAIARST